MVKKAPTHTTQPADDRQSGVVVVVMDCCWVYYLRVGERVVINPGIRHHNCLYRRCGPSSLQLIASSFFAIYLIGNSIDRMIRFPSRFLFNVRRAVADNATSAAVSAATSTSGTGGSGSGSGNGGDDVKEKVRRIMKPRDKRPIIQKQRIVNEEHEKIAKEMGLGWRVIGATVLHRYPTITSDPEPWEVEMHNVREKIGEKQREWFMSQVGGSPSQMIPDNNPTFEEILDSMPFKPASRVTEADEKNDHRSLDRKLPRSLFLVVKRNRADMSWQFPQGRILESETNMRMVAERVIDRAVGKTRRWFVSNAPIGHYCYAYPKEMQEQRKQYGAQVFFYRCQLIEGGVKLETKLYKDYAWISRDEVGEYFDKDTADFMQALLPE